MNKFKSLHGTVCCFTLLLVLTCECAHAGWLEANTPHFTVYSGGNEHELRKDVAQLEAFDQLLRTLTQARESPSAPLVVYLMRSVAELREATGAGRNAHGVYAARIGGTAAFAVSNRQLGALSDHILRHEYAHHFMLQHFAGYYPGWYVEGFAEYVASATFLDDRIEVGRPSRGRATTLLTQPWMPLEQLLNASPHRLGGWQSSQFYAQSWLLVHYLFSTPQRTVALSKYLEDLRNGVPQAAAFATAFGADVAGFEFALKTYMKGQLGFGVLPTSIRAPPSVEIRALPAAAEDLLLPRATSMLGLANGERRSSLLKTVREVAAQHPQDRFAMKVRARAEIDAGDRLVGISLLDDLLETAPNDAELLYLRGRGSYDRGRADAGVDPERYAEARAWFSKAITAAPDFYSAHYRLAQTLDAARPDAAQEKLAAMLKAHSLAPQVGEITLDTARDLIAAGRASESIALLNSLAANPHGGELAQEARNILGREEADRAAVRSH